MWRWDKEAYYCYYYFTVIQLQLTHISIYYITYLVILKPNYKLNKEIRKTCDIEDYLEMKFISGSQSLPCNNNSNHIRQEMRLCKIQLI